MNNLLIDLHATYGTDYGSAAQRVSEKYPAGTGRTRLKWAWAVAQQRGLTADQFDALWSTTAEIIDACWTQEAPGNLASGYQNTYTKVILPPGRYPVNTLIDIPRGGIIGAGSFAYAGTGGDQGQVATEFVMDDAGWIGPERVMFRTPNAGRADDYSYNESFEIRGVRLTGPKKRGDGIVRVGWWIKRAGSTSWINQVQANGFSKGFVFEGGVPMVAGTIRAFECDVAGVSCEGTWGSDLTITKLECDGCGRALQMVPSATDAAGGVLKLGLKVEDGITAGIANPGTVALWLEGQYCVDAMCNLSYRGPIRPDHVFVVRPTIGKDKNGDEMAQSSLLTVQGKGFGFSGLLENDLTGSVWDSAGDYAAFEFRHYANGDRLHTECPTIKGGAAPVDPTPVDPQQPAPAMRSIRGINCANVQKFFPADGLIECMQDLHLSCLRFPGGTVANSYHPDKDLDGMVSMAKTLGLPVVWVANLYSGTGAEMLDAVGRFRAAGVEVIGVELGNEYYLARYDNVFPDALSYLAKASTFITKLQGAFPDIPCGIVAAPSPAMKDADSSTTAGSRLADWNREVLASPLGDARIIHAYADPTEVDEYMIDLSAHVMMCHDRASKPVWITEYNIGMSHGGDDYAQTQTQFMYVRRMLDEVGGMPEVQVMCLHNLIGQGLRNNCIRVTKDKAALTAMGNSWAQMDNWES